MRSLILLVGLSAFSAAADDDGYYQRQLEQRQFDQRQFEQQQQRLAQDRIDQQRTDELFNQQQARRREIAEQGAKATQQNNAMLLQLSLQAGQSRSRRQAPEPVCDEVDLPREQKSDPLLTGYFVEDRALPIFMTSIRLGPEGSGQRLAFTAHLRDGKLPSVVKAPLVDLRLYVRRGNSVKAFKAVSGDISFSNARQNPAHGYFKAEMTNVILVEVDGSKPRPGGACLHSDTFWVDGRWNAER